MTLHLNLLFVSVPIMMTQRKNPPLLLTLPTWEKSCLFLPLVFTMQVIHISQFSLSFVYQLSVALCWHVSFHWLSVSWCFFNVNVSNRQAEMLIGAWQWMIVRWWGWRTTTCLHCLLHLFNSLLFIFMMQGHHNSFEQHAFTLQCIIGLENVWNLTLCSNWQVLPKPVRKNNIKNVEVCGLSACLLSISSIVLTVLVSLDVVSVQSWHMMFDMFICWGLTKVICLIVFCWQIWPLCDDSKKKDDPS